MLMRPTASRQHHIGQRNYEKRPSPRVSPEDHSEISLEPCREAGAAQTSNGAASLGNWKDISERAS